ncbi:YgfZ/GcvT domain-containing protein [Thiohalophilus sp.]|uniref:CAF17-like 4Fe-4S cluster assembly/insertion protein YgfZ n=1 Tax=Thiohalophilus sp. TaxID=3028392 RepID=UPI003974DEB0
MNSEWQTFLQQQQATLEANQVINFGDVEQERQAVGAGTVIADLSHLGLIAASGGDAETFLQGQLTNDIQQVTPQQSQLTAYCNPKGRMLASMRLFRREDRYLLSLPQTVLEPSLKRLRMFVLRSDVSLDDASDELARFGLAGSDAEKLLGAQLPSLPGTVDEVVHHADLTVIRIPGPQARFEIHGSASALSTLWQALLPGATPVGYAAWSWLDTVAGVPTVVPETVETFVPQMANLHSLGGISFTKGCYTGQEVVARMHYLGKLKRRMYRAHTDIDVPPPPGEAIYNADTGTESSAGKVVLALPAPQGGVDLLAVLQISSVEAGPLHLGQPDGPELNLLDLPYEVTNEA